MMVALLIIIILIMALGVDTVLNLIGSIIVISVGAAAIGGIFLFIVL